ncbi:MAG: hydrophobic protein [Candidatus Dormiibacterota bacterium]|jgi:predicted lipid-binding transport protein (Tim44 family)
MLPMLLLLLLVVVFFGLAFAVHLLFIVAIIALVIWLVGFFFRPRGGRWFYW